MKRLYRTLCLVLPPLGFSPAALAQLLEGIELARQGADAVASVRFVTDIQLQRIVQSKSGDQGQAFYRVLPPRDSLQLIGTVRRLPTTGKVPELEVTDESAEPIALQRKIIVRLARAVPYKLRAGRDKRSIDIVFPGLGASLPERAVRSLPQPLPQGYSIVLQSSRRPGFFLKGAVPAKLGEYPVFTTQRYVNGQLVYEIGMGPFPTRAQAEEAMQLLRPRFPQLALLEPPPAPAAAPGGVMPPPSATPEAEAQAQTLMDKARAAIAAGDSETAVAALGEVLNLPINHQTREAMATIGEQRLKLGDTRRARAEFETFLSLYPVGPDSDRVRRLVAALPTPTGQPRREQRPTETTWSGSVAAYYFGGQARERSQEFQDSPISGLPEIVGENTLSSTDQGQFQSSVDLNWRQRNAERDARFVYRDAYTVNFQPGRDNRRRLTALYYDQKSFTNGTQFRVGRQSPVGGGMLYRFDGVTGGYTFAPKWRINAGAGVPVDDLFDTRRRVYGVWLDADALTPSLSGTLYLNHQTIDGLTDRQAVGSELRYFKGGLSMFGQLDYDTALKGVNIVSLQGTWQNEGNTVVNFLYDRRNAPLLSLGNILFFQDPTQPSFAQRVTDLLGTSTLDQLREQVRSVTARQTQALLGFTTPLNDKWQAGGDLRLTNVGAVPAVPAINFPGQASTGNLYGVGAQLIGSNLYSVRDTHVFMATALSGATYQGWLLSYNNLTSVGDGWRLEPSLRYYHQSDNLGVRTERWTPGLRLSYKVRPQMTVESEITWENTRRVGPSVDERSDRYYYMLGARVDF